MAAQAIQDITEEGMFHLATRIRGRRRLLGMTQAEFRKAAGIKSFVITRIESGQRGITAEELEKIASALGVSAHWLRTGHEDAKN